MAKAYVPARFRTGCTNKNCFIQKTPANIKKMAEGLIRYLIDRDLFEDTRVYYKYKDKWYACQPEIFQSDINRGDNWKEINHSHGKKSYKWFEANIDPNRCFEYNGDYLSMSFEGPLYHAINESWYTGDDHIETQLNNYFSHYGLYMEQGHAWNFSLYEI